MFKTSCPEWKDIPSLINNTTNILHELEAGQFLKSSLHQSFGFGDSHEGDEPQEHQELSRLPAEEAREGHCSREGEGLQRNWTLKMRQTTTDVKAL